MAAGARCPVVVLLPLLCYATAWSAARAFADPAVGGQGEWHGEVFRWPGTEPGPAGPPPDRLPPLDPLAAWLRELPPPSATATLLEAPDRSLDAPDEWSNPDVAEGRPWRLRRQTAGPLGSLTSDVLLQDFEADWTAPVRGHHWRTEEAWRLPLAGPVFLFGQLGAGSDPLSAQQLKVAGRTGLAWKMGLGPGSEIQLGGGPALTWDDPLRPERTRERSEWIVELKCRLALVEWLGLEYQGLAFPALSPAERERIRQDLRLAIPVGASGQLRLGAKHRWENTTAPRPWTDGMELYFGVGLGR
jgi:hypothetical protein